jgi:hypothetical protein
MPRLKRVVFWSEARVRVKDLGGYRKTHTVPDRVNAATTRFAAEVAEGQVNADLEAVYATVRQHLGYTRRQVATTPATDGIGSIRTPDFEYTSGVALAADDPSRVVWRREVVPLKGLDLIDRTEFQAAFGQTIQGATFEYAGAVDVEGLVDAIEASRPPGVTVRCGSDGSWCEVLLAGFPGFLRAERNRFDIRGRWGAGARGVAEAIKAFRHLFATDRRGRVLPALAAPQGGRAERR